MKKALTICLVTVLSLGLIAGATCCGILFSNEQILYNALSHNTEKLADYYQKGYNKLNANSYFDFSFTNLNDSTLSSNLKVFLDDDIIVSKLTIRNNNSTIIYDYEGDETASILYCNDNGVKTKTGPVKLEDIVKTAVNVSNDTIYNIDDLANKICYLFKKNTFDKLKFIAYLDQTEGVFDIVNSVIGVKYSQTFADSYGNSLCKVHTTLDKDYNFRDISINISGQTIVMKINSTNTISTLGRKNVEEANEYIG